MFTPLQKKSNFNPLTKARSSLSFSMSALENIRNGNAGLNVEASKGFLKGAGQTAASMGAQNAGPVGQEMLKHAPDFAQNIQGLNEGLKPTNDAQQYGKGSEFVAEMALPADMGADALSGVTRKLIDRSKNVLKPAPDAKGALGQVLQARKPLQAKDMEAFKHINTEGVDTYDELGKRVNSSIGELSRHVDETLAKDPTPQKMGSLKTETVSEGGTKIERNHVQTALEHLKELYEKTADDEGYASVMDIIKQSKKTGLNKKEVNDVARLYNEEFGAKAFGKTGEPLTSVNAQMYENIRKGVKEVARRGVQGTDAEATDKTISSLYGVKKLIGDNAKAVQRLQQKIQERGLIEKVGYKIAKYADVLSGGSIRGFIGGILPRGAGYKVMNALDLQDNLGRNLEIIKKALASGSDDELIKAVKQLEPDPKVPGAAPSTETIKPALDEAYAKAPEAKNFIDNEADKIAQDVGGTVAKAPLKGRARAEEKILNEEQGNVGNLMDIARNTILVSRDAYDKTLEKLMAHPDLHKMRNVKKGDDPLGYTGGIAKIKTPNGHVAEIQFNTPEMIYAKEPADKVRAIIGDDKFNELLAKYGEGGKGHTFYEEWRTLKNEKTAEANTKADALAKESVMYYNRFHD